MQIINDNYINIAYKQKITISKKFDENNSKINVFDEKISINNNLISKNFTSILPLKSNYIIDNIFLFNLDFIKDINFTYNISKFLVYKNNIIYDFEGNSIIELNESCVYLFDSLRNFLFYTKRNIPIFRWKRYSDRRILIQLKRERYSIQKFTNI